MDKEVLGRLVQVGSIVAGVLTALVIVSQHPVIVALLIVEALAYFVGEKVRKS